MKAGIEKDKAALLVVIGAMADGTKEVLAVAPGFRELAESWAAVLRGLKARGLGVIPSEWPGSRRIRPPEPRKSVRRGRPLPPTPRQIRSFASLACRRN